MTILECAHPPTPAELRMWKAKAPEEPSRHVHYVWKEDGWWYAGYVDEHGNTNTLAEVNEKSKAIAACKRDIDLAKKCGVTNDQR